MNMHIMCAWYGSAHVPCTKMDFVGMWKDEYSGRTLRKIYFTSQVSSDSG